MHEHCKGHGQHSNGRSAIESPGPLLLLHPLAGAGAAAVAKCLQQQQLQQQQQQRQQGSSQQAAGRCGVAGPWPSVVAEL